MKLSQLNSNKPKMETIQALNDGADEEDFKQLLEILKGFGQVEVLYDPSDPKDRNVTADEVVDRYENFKKRHKDYVILERKDYEKLVQNSSPEKFNESALEARDASIKLLEQQLARQEDWVNYWKNKYEKCLEELKKETTRWWRF